MHVDKGDLLYGGRGYCSLDQYLASREIKVGRSAELSTEAVGVLRMVKDILHTSTRKMVAAISKAEAK